MIKQETNTQEQPLTTFETPLCKFQFFPYSPSLCIILKRQCETLVCVCGFCSPLWTNHLENKDLLHPKQFGFRLKLLTVMRNCNLTESIKLDDWKLVEQYPKKSLQCGELLG